MVKHLQVTTKAKVQPEYVVELFASVYSVVDHDGDVMAPGVFKASVAKKLPVGIWHHSWDKPIAKTLVARDLAPNDPLLPEDLRPYGGLYIKAQFFPDIPSSLEAYMWLEKEVIEEFSVGFVIEDYEYENTVRVIKQAELFEWSPVMRGANDLGRVLAMKGYTFKQHTDLIVLELEEYATRVEELYELRGKLSEEKIQVLTSLHDRLATIISPVVVSDGKLAEANAEAIDPTGSEEPNKSSNEEPGISLEDFIKWGETI